MTNSKNFLNNLSTQSVIFPIFSCSPYSRPTIPTTPPTPDHLNPTNPLKPYLSDLSQVGSFPRCVLATRRHNHSYRKLRPPCLLSDNWDYADSLRFFITCPPGFIYFLGGQSITVSIVLMVLPLAHSITTTIERVSLWPGGFSGRSYGFCFLFSGFACALHFSLWKKQGELFPTFLLK